MACRCLVLLLSSSILCSAQESPKATPVFSAKDRVYVGINFSPDGKLLALSGESFVSVLNTADYRPVQELRQRGLVDEVVFDPETRMLVSRGKSIDTLVWEVATWKQARVDRRAAPDANGAVLETYAAIQWGKAHGSCPAAFSPDGSWIALSNGRKGIRLWQMKTFSPRRTEVVEFEDYAEGRLEHANALLFAGRFLLLGEEGGFITPLPLEKWEALSSAESSAAAMRAVPMPESSTPSVTRREHDAFRRHSNHVTSLSLTPDGKLCISAGTDGKVHAWTLGGLLSPTPAKPEWTLPGHYAALSPDGRSLAVAEEKGIRVYEFPGRSPIGWLPEDPRTGRFVRIRFNPAGTALASLSCVCDQCVHREDGSLAAYKTRLQRVHHHGGALMVWAVPGR